MARRVGATDLRQRLTDPLQAVREEHETYVVETFGRPQATLPLPFLARTIVYALW